MTTRHAIKLVFTALGMAMVLVALASPELSGGFKLATILVALVIGAIIGMVGDGEDA